MQRPMLITHPLFYNKTRNENVDKVLELLKDIEDPEFHKILKAAARRRPWRPKRKGWANVLDQLLHALYGAILLLPILLSFSYWGAAIMGFLAGTIREIEQYFNQDLKIRMIWDRIQDISSFIVGAVVLFYVLHYVKAVLL